MKQRRKKGDCYIQGICLVENCEDKQRNKGFINGRKRYDLYCSHHHALKYNIKLTDFGKHFAIKKKIDNRVCEKCGWKEAPCDRHKKDKTLPYYPENVIVLCPNCHRVEHYENRQRKVLKEIQNNKKTNF